MSPFADLVFRSSPLLWADVLSEMSPRRVLDLARPGAQTTRRRYIHSVDEEFKNNYRERTYAKDVQYQWGEIEGQLCGLE